MEIQGGPNKMGRDIYKQEKEMAKGPGSTPKGNDSGNSAGTVDSGGVNAIGGGYFSVDGKTVNVTDLIMMITVKMKETNDELLARKYGEVEQKLEDQQALNDALTTFNKYARMFDDDGKVKDGTDGQTDGNKKVKLTNSDLAELLAAKDVLAQYGISIDLPDNYEIADNGKIYVLDPAGNRIPGPDGDMQVSILLTQEDVQNIVGELEGELQNMSTQNELDMMELNKLMSLNTTCMQLGRSGLDEAKNAMQTAAK